MPRGSLQQCANRGDLQDQPVRVPLDRCEAVVTVEAGGSLVDRVHHDQPATSELGCSSGSAQRVHQHLGSVAGAMELAAHRKPG